jgi:hypothetical protein
MALRPSRVSTGYEALKDHELRGRQLMAEQKRLPSSNEDWSIEDSTMNIPGGPSNVGPNRSQMTLTSTSSERKHRSPARSTSKRPPRAMSSGSPELIADADSADEDSKRQRLRPTTFRSSPSCPRSREVLTVNDTVVQPPQPLPQPPTLHTPLRSGNTEPTNSVHSASQFVKTRPRSKDSKLSVPRAVPRALSPYDSAKKPPSITFDTR